MLNYTVLLPDDAGECLEYCAEELRCFIEKTTGVRLPVVKESAAAGVTSYVISLGKTNRLKGLDFKPDYGSLNGDGFYIKNSGSDLFITGATDRGTLYGVYELAERNGIKFISPDYTYYPALKEFKLRGFGEIKEVPDFRYRGLVFRAVFRADADKVFYARTRNSHELIKVEEKYGGQIRICQCPKEKSHNALEFAPPEKYFATEEQKRQNAGMYVLDDKGNPFDICWTNGINEDGTVNETMKVSTLKAVIETLKEFVIKEPGAEYYFIGQMDYERVCCCRDCVKSKLKYRQAGTQIRFLNAVVREVNKWAKTRPELKGKTVKVSTFSYLYSTEAPVKKDEKGRYVAIDDTVIPDENLCIRLTPYRANWYYALSDRHQSEQYRHYVEKWQALAHNFMVWDYGTQFSNYFIYFSVDHRIKKSLKEFKRAGVFYYFLQMAHTEYDAVSLMKNYAYGKLMWNLKRNPYKLRREFVKYYYGSGSKTVLKIMRRWERLYRKNQRKSFGEFVKKSLLDGIYYPAAKMEKAVRAMDAAILKEREGGGADKELIIKHLEQFKIFPLHTLFRARAELYYGNDERQREVYREFFALAERLGITDYGEGLKINALKTADEM